MDDDRREELLALASYLEGSGTCLRGAVYLRKLATVGLAVQLDSIPLGYLRTSPGLTHESISVSAPFPEPIAPHELIVSFRKRRLDE